MFSPEQNKQLLALKSELEVQAQVAAEMAAKRVQEAAQLKIKPTPAKLLNSEGINLLFIAL